MPDLSELPPTLRPLIERFQGDIDRLMDALISGQLTAEGWVANMEEAISLYHMVALAAGQQDSTIRPETKKLLDDLIDVQFAFLAGFGSLVGTVSVGKRLEEMANRFRARARTYALAVKVAWHEGDAIRQAGRPLPLPAMPAQGTQCLNNCGCNWDIVTLDNEAGNFDCFWVRGKDDSCQTCLAREALWNGPGGDRSRPVQIRKGRLVPVSGAPPTYR